jgi:hypothetical protein
MNIFKLGFFSKSEHFLHGIKKKKERKKHNLKGEKYK